MGREFGKKQILEVKKQKYGALMGEIKAFYYAFKQWEEIDIKCAGWFIHRINKCEGCDWGDYCKDCLIIHLKGALISLGKWLKDWIQRVEQGEGKTVYACLEKEFDDWCSKYYDNVHRTGKKGSLPMLIFGYGQPIEYPLCPIYMWEGIETIKDWTYSLRAKRRREWKQISKMSQNVKKHGGTNFKKNGGPLRKR